MLFEFELDSEMMSFRLDSQTQLNSGFDAHGIVRNEWSRSKVLHVGGIAILRVDSARSRSERFAIRLALNQGFACVLNEFQEPANGKIRSAVLNLELK